MIIVNKNKIIKNAFINIGCLNIPNYKMVYNKIDKIKEKIRINFLKFNNSTLCKIKDILKII